MKMYPKFKYHKTEPAKLILHEASEKALGEEWADSPADFGVITHPNPDEEAAKAEAKAAAKKESKKKA